MARKILNATDIEFEPLTGTLKIPQLIHRSKLLLITNVTVNKIVYNFADPALGLYDHILDNTTNPARGSTTLVLQYNTANMLSTDKFQIVYDENNERFEPADYMVDAVGKLRTSNPKSLIDTDFEYGIQNSKWETLTMIQNYPGFYGRSSGGNALDVQLVQGDNAAPFSTHCFATSALNVSTEILLFVNCFTSNFSVGSIRKSSSS